MKNITVLKPGTDVVIAKNNTDDKYKNIPATVVEIVIGDSFRIQYKAVWWDKTTRHVEWLDPSEIETAADDDDSIRIGFS